MKKCILNDVTCFAGILGILFFSVCLVLALQSSNNMQSDITSASVCGGFILLGLLVFIGTFELVFFEEHEIVSVKIYKRTRILYSEIVSIEECVENYILICHPTSATFVKIRDCNKKNISVLKDIVNEKKKTKLVEEVKQKAINAEIQTLPEEVK